MLVSEQPAGRGITSDVDVWPTIVVIVGCHHRHRIRTADGSYTCLLAHFGKRSVAIVMEQLHRASRKTTRATIYRNTFPGAVSVLPWLRQFFQCGIEIVGNEKI